MFQDGTPGREVFPTNCVKYFRPAKKQCQIIPGDPPSKMSLHPSKTNIEPKDWSLENPWGPEGNLRFHKGEFQDPCQFYRTRCSECSGSISQLPFQSRTESAQIYDTITVPHSSPCGVSTVSSCLYLDKRDSIGNSEPTNSRANPSPPWGPADRFGSTNRPFPGDQHSREWGGFQDAIYMIHKPPLLFPSFSFRHSLCIILQDFQGSFYPQGLSKAEVKANCLVLCMEMYTNGTPSGYHLSTLLCQKLDWPRNDHMAMVALLHWNCNKSLQNPLLLP